MSPLKGLALPNAAFAGQQREAKVREILRIPDLLEKRPGPRNSRFLVAQKHRAA
jgi:hypothetical protein